MIFLSKKSISRQFDFDLGIKTIILRSGGINLSAKELYMQVGDYVYVSEFLWAEYKKKTSELGLMNARNAFVYFGTITVGEKFGILRLLPEMEELKFKAFGHKFGVGEYIASNCPSWHGVPSPASGVYLFFIRWNDVCPEFQNKD